MDACSGRGDGCMNGGTCSSVNGSDVCLCQQGFNGPLCAQCPDHECHGNSSCRRDPDTTAASCDCAHGLTGEHCETGICSNDDCVHGTCTMEKGHPRCACDPGYGGALCQLALGECHFCKNGGTCVRESSTGYRCLCDARYGSSNCEVDLCTCSPGCNSDDCIGCPEGTSRPDHLCGSPLPLYCSNGSMLCLNGGTCQDAGIHAL